MSLSLVIAPTEEPVSIDLATIHLRLVGADSDDLAFVEDVVIPAARERAEVATRRQINLATWDLVLEEFPAEGFIEIPKPPLVSVLSVKYVDTAGVTQTWASGNYLVQAPAGPRCARGRIALPFASVWPITLRQMGSVTVRFQAGYLECPPLLKSGILMDAGMLYEQRESVMAGSGRSFAIEVPRGSKMIYDSFRSYPTYAAGTRA